MFMHYFLPVVLSLGCVAGQGSQCPTRCKDSEACTQVLGKWVCLYQMKKDAEQNQMLEKINAERQKLGLKSLRENAFLNAAAQRFAELSAAIKQFGHSGPDGSLPWDRAWKEGFEGKSVGENVAGDQNVDRAHTALMNSPGHRANILSSGYSQVGIGVSPDSRFGKFYVQLFGDGPDSPVSSAVVVPPPTLPLSPSLPPPRPRVTPPPPPPPRPRTTPPPPPPPPPPVTTPPPPPPVSPKPSPVSPKPLIVHKTLIVYQHLATPKPSLVPKPLVAPPKPVPHPPVAPTPPVEGNPGPTTDQKPNESIFSMFGNFVQSLCKGKG